MKIEVSLKCPSCSGTSIKKNGYKYNKKQDYLCKSCKRQFIGNHALTYKAWHSNLAHEILLMPVRGLGVGDIATIEQISIKKVLSVLV